MNKFPKLLQLLLAPFFVFVGEEGGGGAADRGDTLAAGAPDADAQAKADADAEAERIRAEEAAKASGSKTDDGKDGKDGDGKDDKDDGKDGKDGKPAMIPVERHKAVLDRTRAERDALAAQLANHQKGQQVVATNTQIAGLEEKVTTKEAEYNKLLVDGETEKATAVMREIRTLEREMVDLKADMKAQASTARAIEQVRYDTVVERLEAAYPALNPDHEDFDKAQVGEVMEIQRGLVATGKTPSEALQKAVKLIMGATTSKQDTAVNVTPRVDEAAATAAERKAAATAKGVDAATKTPPSTSKVGADSDKAGGGAITPEDVMKMGQDKFAGLNEETLSRLRGDTV